MAGDWLSGPGQVAAALAAALSLAGLVQALAGTLALRRFRGPRQAGADAGQAHAVAALADAAPGPAAPQPAASGPGALQPGAPAHARSAWATQEPARPAGPAQDRAATPAAAPRPAVSILKPLHGDEPMLEEALASFCRQDYPRFQLVFGLQDPADPAIAVVERLRARFPDLDMALVVDPTPHGANRKIANLLNMYPRARHDVLVIADSDMHAAPDYLSRLVERLEQPGTGLVTTLYAGVASSGGLSGLLGCAHINHSFLPGALMARALGRQDCLGATMALRRSTLERVGGLHALSPHLADDAVLGQLVSAEGLAVRLAATVPATTVPETRLARLFHHELRWARTIRAVAPVGFVLSVVQYPLFWALLCAALAAAQPWSLWLLGACWLGRALLGRAVDAMLGSAGALPRGRASPLWLAPLRDVMSVAVMLASYADNTVAWRGQVMRTSGKAIAKGALLRPARGTLAPGEGLIR